MSNYEITYAFHKVWPAVATGQFSVMESNHDYTNR